MGSDFYQENSRYPYATVSNLFYRALTNLRPFSSRSMKSQLCNGFKLALQVLNTSMVFN